MNSLNPADTTVILKKDGILYLAQPLGTELDALADGLYVFSPKLPTPTFEEITQTPTELNIPIAIPTDSSALKAFLRGSFLYYTGLLQPIPE